MTEQGNLGKNTRKKRKKTGNGSLSGGSRGSRTERLAKAGRREEERRSTYNIPRL
jgi:hypothetical protein